MLKSIPLAMALIAGLAVAAPTVTPAFAQETKMTQRTITISASGSVTAVPDRVFIALGVMSEAKTARAALDANTAAMRKVIDTLKAEGLEDRDVQTSDFSIGPRYEYPQDGKPPKLVGYQVSNVVNKSRPTPGLLRHALGASTVRFGERRQSIDVLLRLQDNSLYGLVPRGCYSECPSPINFRSRPCPPPRTRMTHPNSLCRRTCSHMRSSCSSSRYC